MDRVVGITSTRFLFNKDMQRQVDEGLTRRIGIEGNFDNEVIMSINPDLMLISPFKRGGYDAVKDIGIPLVPHLGYKEMTPPRSGRVDQVWSVCYWAWRMWQTGSSTVSSNVIIL